MTTDHFIQENFDALYEIAKSVNSILEPAELLERVLEIAMTRLSAERGFIILSNPDCEHGYEVAVLKNFSSQKTTSVGYKKRPHDRRSSAYVRRPERRAV